MYYAVGRSAVLETGCVGLREFATEGQDVVDKADEEDGANYAAKDTADYCGVIGFG